MTSRVRARAWLPYAIAAATGFLLAFGLVAMVLFPPDDTVQEVRVPSVMGLPYADAERRLRAMSLKVSLGQERESPDVPRNAVVGQTPVAGETVNAGTEVVLDVSQGQGRSTTVPSLIGSTREDAETRLVTAGLALGDVTEQASDKARGIVLSTTPEGGQPVSAGSRVAVVVSSGPAELSLPDVVGRDLPAARGTLEQLGLSPVVEYDSLSSLPSGTIVAQSPAAGASVAPGTNVTLRVSGKP
jgi:serine/threonine-protein kinase